MKDHNGPPQFDERHGKRLEVFSIALTKCGVESITNHRGVQSRSLVASILHPNIFFPQIKLFKVDELILAGISQLPHKQVINQKIEINLGLAFGLKHSSSNLRIFKHNLN